MRKTLYALLVAAALMAALATTASARSIGRTPPQLSVTQPVAGTVDLSWSGLTTPKVVLYEQTNATDPEICPVACGSEITNTGGYEFVEPGYAGITETFWVCDDRYVTAAPYPVCTAHVSITVD